MSKRTILAQIAPQRSAQYASLASTLAESELLLSSLGPQIVSIQTRSIGSQDFLEIELEKPILSETLLQMGTLAMTSAFYQLFEDIEGVKGPFLKPLETPFIPSQPKSLVTTRRYKGKTNELFTHWMCNVAKMSSKFSDDRWSSLRVLDPISGGGTTLMTALVLGAGHVAGVEHNEKDVESTATFLKQFAKEERIPIKVQKERLKKLGRRWTIGLGEKASLRTLRLESLNNDTSKDERNAADRQVVTLAQGDTRECKQLLPSFRPHLIIGDLPYGIHHQGKLLSLLDESMPVWSDLLLTGGTIALSWDATRFSKDEMLSSLEKHSTLTVLKDAIYDGFAHRVDRVIKKRDVVILYK